MKITFASALVQGLVAISLVTVIVVIFTLSRQYFNLTLKWVERGSFGLMILFGIYWCYQVYRTVNKARKPIIKSIRISQKKLENYRLLRRKGIFIPKIVAVAINICQLQMKCSK